MTSPAIRHLFMTNRRNFLRTREAVLSLLAGDLFRGTPIYWSLRAFKGVYYVTSLFNLRRCLAAWRRRRQVNRDSSAEGTGGARA
jgi:hypothetical protein